jgi:hypothetical protein
MTISTELEYYTKSNFRQIIPNVIPDQDPVKKQNGFVVSNGDKHINNKREVKKQET